MEERKNTDNEDTAGHTETEEIVPVYANNVRFEMTAWDLRLLFGQLLPASENKGLVDWHTDVTIPWAQAKLMHLYLGINITLYERENGKISVPQGVLPPAATTPPPGVDPTDPEAMKTFEQIRNMIEDFRTAALSAR